jgi:dTDP-4-dehydrorhamnose reductase
MTILVIGGSGVIGSKLVDEIKKQKQSVFFTFLKNNRHTNEGNFLDITQKEQTVTLIKKLKPKIIIHTTALTNVDLCETDKQLAESINVHGIENVVAGAKEISSKIVFVSTSAVFNGKKDRYTEDDKMSPISHYGLTKAKGEEIVKESSLPYLILRTDQPYCWAEKWQHTNSVLRVLDTLKSGKKLKEITDWYNTPTYVPDFANIALRLVDSNEEGIFHLVGPDFLNRYDFSLKVCQFFGLNKNMIMPINSNEFGLPAKRANVRLLTERLQRIRIQMIGIERGLHSMHNLDHRNCCFMENKDD